MAVGVMKWSTDQMAIAVGERVFYALSPLL
jgi:hypothetical protein